MMSGLSPKPAVAEVAQLDRAVRKRKRQSQVDHVTQIEWLAPWLSALPTMDSQSKEQRLHHEIVAFLAFVEPTAEEEKAQDLVLCKVKGVLENRFSECTVSTYGSVAYGLSLPDGDLDLVISTREVYNKDYLIRVLFQLSSRLKNSGMASTCQVIGHARVPIIKLETRTDLASFKFDININSEDGLRAVPSIKQYVEAMPALKPLVLVMKTFLAMRNLNSPATGGLGSYATICMIVGFLKLNPNKRPKEYFERPLESESLGTLLIDFFDFYGNKFPYGTSYISAPQGKVLPKELKGWLNDKYPEAFSIECLMDPANDVGKSAQKVRKIRLAFKEACQVLQSYQFALPPGNISESIIGISHAMLVHREHVHELVTSGSLERLLVTLGPTQSQNYVGPRSYQQTSPIRRDPLPSYGASTSRHVPYQPNPSRYTQDERRPRYNNSSRYALLDRLGARDTWQHDHYHESYGDQSDKRVKRRRM